MKRLIFIFIGLLIIVSLGSLFVSRQGVTQSKITSQPTPIQPKISASPQPTSSKMITPIAEFEKRITKKPFGIYITPQNSPIQPERFTGFHTGVDVEYENTTNEIPVFSVCDGEIVLAKWVSGYGGTISIECQLKNETVYLLYGHLNQNSFIKNNTVKKGEKIAVLGEGQTQATDFERKHLHFAISKNKLDLRGYTKTKEELTNWYDPQEFLLAN